MSSEVKYGTSSATWTVHMETLTGKTSVQMQCICLHNSVESTLVNKHYSNAYECYCLPLLYSTMLQCAVSQTQHWVCPPVHGPGLGCTNSITTYIYGNTQRIFFHYTVDTSDKTWHTGVYSRVVNTPEWRASHCMLQLHLLKTFIFMKLFSINKLCMGYYSYQ